MHVVVRATITLELLAYENHVIDDQCVGKCLVHSLVSSRIDYCYAIFFGITDRLLHRLEIVQRSAVRVVIQIGRGDRRSMAAVLRHLLWLQEHI